MVSLAELLLRPFAAISFVAAASSFGIDGGVVESFCAVNVVGDAVYPSDIVGFTGPWSAADIVVVALELPLALVLPSLELVLHPLLPLF